MQHGALGDGCQQLDFCFVCLERKTNASRGPVICDETAKVTVVRVSQLLDFSF